MYLVDTSVWIDYIKGRNTETVVFLDNLLVNPLAIGINQFIYLEILQGAADEQNFERFRNYFSTQRFYPLSFDSYEQAAKIYFDCRRKGITIRSSLDCLIAQGAIEHNLILLHHDRDYLQIGSVYTQLKQQHFLSTH